MSYITQEICNRIKMPEMLKFYGFDIKKNRIKCPLHNGEDYNCGVKQDYIHCFVCGESADQISFVMKYFGLSFKEAISKINIDFSLGLPIGEKIDRRKRIELSKKCFLANQQRQKENEEKQKLLSEYHTAFDEYVRLENQRKKYKPKSMDEQPHPLFIESLMNLDYAEYRLDCAETELYLYETRNSCDT